MCVKRFWEFLKVSFYWSVRCLCVEREREKGREGGVDNSFNPNPQRVKIWVGS